MANQGADKLSNQELLAVLFSSENVSHTISEITEALLAAFDGNLKELFCATIEQLTQVGGIGFSEACKIKAAFELGKRASAYWEADTVVVKSTDDVVPLVLSDMIFLKQEQFRVILLDSKNKVIRNCYPPISRNCYTYMSVNREQWKNDTSDRA